MSGPWTHSICERCWEQRSPGRQPVKMKHRVSQTCCFCENAHSSSIYVRESVENTICKAWHKDDD